jgi:polar amino acid transport system ATP-binding protein
MVIVDTITIKRNNQLVVDHISCTLEPGHITSFIGKSGAGKTTLLKALVGLVPIAQGSILINDMQLNTLTPKERAKNIGYVFQEFNLFPHYTVLENCVNPQIVYGIPRTQAHQQAMEILTQLGMHDFAQQYPAQLSGGQQQRTAIARALCLKPTVLLLDEPTASLDPFNTDILVTILQTLASNGLTIGLSTQDMSFVRKIFDRVYYIDNGKIAEFCDGIEQLTECTLIRKFI